MQTEDAHSYTGTKAMTSSSTVKLEKAVGCSKEAHGCDTTESTEHTRLSAVRDENAKSVYVRFRRIFHNMYALRKIARWIQTESDAGTLVSFQLFLICGRALGGVDISCRMSVCGVARLIGVSVVCLSVVGRCWSVKGQFAHRSAHSFCLNFPRTIAHSPHQPHTQPCVSVLNVKAKRLQPWYLVFCRLVFFIVSCL